MNTFLCIKNTFWKFYQKKKLQFLSSYGENNISRQQYKMAYYMKIKGSQKKGYCLNQSSTQLKHFHFIFKSCMKVINSNKLVSLIHLLNNNKDAYNNQFNFAAQSTKEVLWTVNFEQINLLHN